jgi:hypothetical protein
MLQKFVLLSFFVILFFLACKQKESSRPIILNGKIMDAFADTAVTDVDLAFYPVEKISDNQGGSSTKLSALPLPCEVIIQSNGQFELSCDNPGESAYGYILSWKPRNSLYYDIPNPEGIIDVNTRNQIFYSGINQKKHVQIWRRAMMRAHFQDEEPLMPIGSKMQLICGAVNTQWRRLSKDTVFHIPVRRNITTMNHFIVNGDTLLIQSVNTPLDTLDKYFYY